MKSEKQQAKEAMQDITRAERAQEFLNNPLYIEAITVMKAAMFEQFSDTRFGDEKDRHELWQRMQLMKQFQSRFESIVKKGEKGKETLSLLDKALQKIRL